jgi:L-lactate dehydrogenase (cytochrome)
LLKLRQRMAIDVERRFTGSTMLDTPVTLPIAIAPTGLAGRQ